MTTLRLFAAIRLPEPVVADLRRVTDQRTGPLRWSAPERWHVTAAFFGDVPERDVTPLADRLAKAAGRSPAFELRVAGFGGFPSARRARVVYARLDGDTDDLERLAARCAAAGRRTGLAMERRRFRPHVTVGRSAGDTDVTGLLPAYQGPTWLIDRLHLVRSWLGPSPRHETMQNWPLTSPRGVAP